ncbi:hypothetical protein JL475_28040, partial [Streptomyces sp. M2CJ-2]|nr:hypothetical protein [Streptomyces sp. M2CJ-2]
TAFGYGPKTLTRILRLHRALALARTSAPPAPGTPGDGAPVNHLPTLVAGQNTTPPPGPTPGSPAAGQAPVAYGHPQQHAQPHPQPPGYGYPYNAYGAAGSTPPYGPNPPPYGPARTPRSDRSTALLVVIALVVAIAAGGTVYALMSSNGGDSAGGDPTATATGDTSRGTDPTADGEASTGPDGSGGAGGAGGTGDPTRSGTPTPTDGVIPTGYLGSWSTTIDNASGVHTRTLTIQQGEVGDTVMSLVADGPTGNGTYHCVFEGSLSDTPGSGDRLRIGPSSVTVGQPRSACTPGSATEITLRPDGSLQRVNTSNGEQLVYTRD